VSLHDVALASELQKVLNGEYQPILAGKQSDVKVEVLKVVLEGMGALFGHPLPKKLTILDFGNGTTLYSRYNRGKLQFAIRNSQFAIRNSVLALNTLLI
ncbi:MAG: hypothetical protein ACYTXM_42435, partial [Nostoc sp.]